MVEMRWKYLVREYTWLIILVAVGISFLYPDFGIKIKPGLAWLLMILMFLSSIGIEFGRALKHLKKIRKVIVSLLIIFLVSPLVLLCFRNYFSDEIFLGMILASVTPAGMSAVFLATMYGGSNAKSLVVMSVSNVLSIILYPVLVLMFAHVEIDVDFWAMVLNMMKLILVPFVLALLLRRTIVRKVVDDHGTYFSVGILFLLIVGVVSPVSLVILANVDLAWRLLVFIFVLVFLNFLLGYWLGSDRKAKITYAIVCSYKNFSLATVIALTLFNPTVALPAVVYTIVNNVFLIPLQFFIRK